MGKLFETTETQDRIELIIFGDSTTKYTSPEKTAKSDVSNTVNYSKTGIKVRGIYNQLHQFHSNHGNESVKNVILHVGTNHLPKDDQDDVTI